MSQTLCAIYWLQRQPWFLHQGQIIQEHRKCRGNHQSVSIPSLALACDTVHWVVISLTLSRRKQSNLISSSDQAAVTGGNTKAIDIIHLFKEVNKIVLVTGMDMQLMALHGVHTHHTHVHVCNQPMLLNLLICLLETGVSLHGIAHTPHTYVCVISQCFLTFLPIYWKQVFLCTGQLF